MAHDKNGRIEVGSRVRVDIVPDGFSQPYFVGTLVGRPQDVGDTFRVSSDETGRVVEFNPNSSHFVSIAEMDAEVALRELSR